MKSTYSVFIGDKSIGTLDAENIDEATEMAVFLYGADASVVKQYSTSTIGIDPLWILLAILLGAMYFKKKHT